ncbi:glycosyltransferase family 4 protein [Pseudonocardia sp. WMMC193]|uniref:glycosyltransferase family 4 protein n=1 Tax=Pseudonocardia sp. WMMC193 TaxID=2911965 RepID=UPI001F2371A8|nr:glycosyltransferase family 4 protein [Pseudonocardia sp. WMMC193]MCF7553840.1 glycosyltransferase family 4 protein [Pseudonocardia sp. WMMC193]
MPAAGALGRPRVLVVHPSAELYGSDRVALETVRALVEAGATVEVVLAGDGPLAIELAAVGVRVSVVPLPVLRKSVLTPRGILGFVGGTLRWTPRAISRLRATRPAVVYVSTVTMPWWLVLARLVGARPVCHVHEAEEDVPCPVRWGLAAPLLAAASVIANSARSAEVVGRAIPRLERRTRVVYNGVPGPDHVTAPRESLDGPVRLVLIGRLSPRKGTDVAVQALAELVNRGRDVTLDLVGGAFTGYEWFVDQVRAAATDAGVADRVRWRGELPDVWQALAEADVALVPSRVEPFGNAAVEALLAGRPVVAGDTQGLREIVRPGVNGELVTPGDAASLADAVERIVEDWPTALERTVTAREAAERDFAPPRYRRDVVAIITEVADR